MRYIVEYKLHAGKIPYFIEDGGYFKSGNKLIGITYDSSKNFIPKFNTEGGELKVFTGSELIDHIVNQVMPSVDGTELTADEKTTHVNAWLVSHNLL